MKKTKEVSILAHIYKELETNEDFTEKMQNEIYCELNELLEAKGYSFQFHEAEVQEY